MEFWHKRIRWGLNDQNTVPSKGPIVGLQGIGALITSTGFLGYIILNIMIRSPQVVEGCCRWFEGAGLLGLLSVSRVQVWSLSLRFWVLLGGSWVVVTLILTPIRGRIRPLIATLNPKPYRTLKGTP